MISHSGILVPALMGMMAISVGCTYHHRVVNTGDSALYAVTVQSGSVRFGHGYLGPGSSATYTGSMRIMRSPAPVLSWKTSEDGPAVVQRLEVDRNPGRREVWFEIDGKTAKAVLSPR